MNVSINPHWAAFKAHLIRTIGRDEAGNWLRYAGAVMDVEAKRFNQPIDGQAKQVERSL